MPTLVRLFFPAEAMASNPFDRSQTRSFWARPYDFGLQTRSVIGRLFDLGGRPISRLRISYLKTWGWPVFPPVIRSHHTAQEEPCNTCSTVRGCGQDWGCY